MSTEKKTAYKPSKKRANRKVPYCIISHQTNNKWFDFTLQKNHLFGEDYRGKFVVCGMDDKYVYLYRATLNVPTIDGRPNPKYDPRPSLRGAHIWTRERVSRNTMTGRLVLDTWEETGKKPVMFKATHKLVGEMYNPRDTVWDSGFTPMPHMMIPGGSYAKADAYTTKA